MGLLAVCDLHGRRDWYQWLLWKARRCRLVVISGDLIDAGRDTVPQIRRLLVWIREIALLKTPVLIASGNHDQLAFPIELAGGLSLDVSIEAVRRDCWLDILGMLNPHCVISKSRLLLKEKLILTSLPEEADASFHEHLMEQGAALRREISPESKWIVARHRPPEGRWAKPEHNSSHFYRLIELFQPNFVVCGHVHNTPLSEGVCTQQIGLTRIFNPGCRFKSTYPSHVVIDPITRRFSWLK